jgi:thiamine pyrophosphokinase
MKIPKELSDKSEWVLVGPMGPPLPQSFFHHPILAVDGGARFTEKMVAWIGDSDSVQAAPASPVVIKLSPEKDASDFSCALGFFQNHLNYTFHLWGFSGGRKDHELFVWGEILSFLEKHPKSKMILYGASGRIEEHFLGSGQWRFQHKGLFSLGSIREIRVKLTGDVKFPILTESPLPALSSLGLSNIGNGEIILENEGAAFLHYPEKE